MQEAPRLHQCDLDRIFPMSDHASAWLMQLKARCLCEAGVMSPTLRAEIDRRATLVALSAGPPAPGLRRDRRSLCELST
jgi:hypothetical protein